MNENPVKTDNLEKMANLRLSIIDAIDHAGSLEEYNANREEIGVLTSRFLKHKISEAKYAEKMKELYRPVGETPGGITFDLLSDFIYAVKYSVDRLHLTDETAQYLVSHENAHRSVAESYGVPSLYALRFLETAPSKYGVVASVELEWPAGMHAEKRAMILSEIISAPEDLSVNDSRMLGYKSV